MANIDDELKAIDAQPQQGGGIDAALAAIDQPQQPQSPWWSWARIKQAYESSPEIADVRPVLGKLGKNAAIGAAEGATGIAELIPGNTYAAKETQALEKASDPEWQYRLAKDAGYAAPFLLGGGGGLTARLVPDAEKGASFLTKLATGAKKGAATGAAAGAAMPTGKEDTGKRYWEKGFDTAVGAGGGAFLGTAGAVGENAAKIYTTATGKAAKEAAEGVRSEVTGKVSSTAKEMSGGMSQEEMDAARVAADKITQELSSNPIMDQTQISNLIRKSAQDIYAKGDAARRAAAGFPQVMRKYGNEPIVDVTHINKEIADRLKTVAPGTTVADELNQIKGWLSSAPDGKISLPVADSVRKELQKVITSKSMAVNGGQYRPADRVALEMVRHGYKMLTAAAEDAAPEYKTAIDAWRKMSGPLRDFERKGSLAKALQTDDLSGDYAKLEGGIIKELMNKARQGDTTFQRLMEKDPSLKDSARQYFQGQMFGGSLGEKTVDSGKMAKYLNENERALKQLGLYDEFSASQKTLQTGETIEGLQKYEDTLVKFNDKNMSSRDVVKNASSVADMLRKDGHLSREEYDQLLGTIKAADDRYQEKDELDKVMKHIMGWTIVGAFGLTGLRILKSTLNW